MDELPFVVLTRDKDEPTETPNERIRASHLQQARKTVLRREKRDLYGDWADKSTGKAILLATYSSTMKSPGKKKVVVRNSELAPTIDRIPV